MWVVCVVLAILWLSKSLASRQGSAQHTQAHRLVGTTATDEVARQLCGGNN